MNTFRIFNLPFQLITLNYCWRNIVFLKKLCFTFIAGILLHCLVLYDILRAGIIKQRYFGEVLVILKFCRTSKIFYTYAVAKECPYLIFGIVFPWRSLLLRHLLLNLHYTEWFLSFCWKNILKGWLYIILP